MTRRRQRADYHRQWRRSHTELFRTTDREWRRSKGRTTSLTAPSNDPARARARDSIRRMLRRGELSRPDRCECCDSKPGTGSAGQSLIYAVFSDPADPLNGLVWFCSMCVGELSWKDPA